MIAYCGLDCTTCPVYRATLANDDKMREEAARLWTELFKHELKPEQMNCTGCKSDGKRFFFCRICGVMKCAIERGLDNCAVCPDFSCEKIEGLMQMDPNVKKALEEIRRQMGK